MKKVLVWIVLLAIASVIALSIPKMVHSDKQYLSSEEIMRESKIIGTLTAIDYGIFIAVGVAVTKSITNRKRIEKAMEETRIRELEAQKAAEEELPGALPMIRVPDIPGYGSCPKCGQRNQLGRQTCFGCGIPLKRTEMVDG